MKQVTERVKGEVWNGVYLCVSCLCQDRGEPEAFWKMFNTIWGPVGVQVRDIFGGSSIFRFVD
jgi:hypothetical protein